MTPTITQWSDRLAWLTAILVAGASAAGLLVTDLYRDNDAMVAQARGADIGTLLAAVPALVVGLWVARSGSIRGRLVALGLRMVKPFDSTFFVGTSLVIAVW